MARPLPLLAAALLAAAGEGRALAPLAPLALAQGRRAPEGEPAAGPAMRPTIEGLRRYAEAQVRARKLPEAIHAYQQILRMAPGDDDALAHLAQLQAWSGDHDRAIVLYRDAIARRPGDLGLRSDLADVLTWARRLEEAERLYEEVLARDPEHHEALKGLARARLLHGDAAGAAGALARALALYPDDADLHRESARLHTQTGELDRAVEELRAATRLLPGEPSLLRQLGEVLLQKKDFAAAAGVWTQVAQLEPESPAAQVALARAFLGMGKLAAAREHADLALRLGPSDAAAAQVSAELSREAGLAPLRTAGEWFEVLAYVSLLPLVLLVARKTRRSLRRRPAAWTFAIYVAPAFILLNVVSHFARGWLARWVDVRIFEAATEVVLFLGLGAAFLAVLRAEPPVREFADQVVLAIGAHPDDVELGCAGFLAKLKASGAQVHALTLTRGEQGTSGGDRVGEARRAAAFLRLDGHEVLDLPDTGLSDQVPAVKAAIEARVKALRPTLVLTHTDVDVHGDHRAVHAATREAARAVPTLLCYEDVSTTAQFTPNLYVDIGSYLDDHLRACAFHQSQAHRSYMDPQVIQGRAAHRGMQIGAHFALAFRAVSLIR
ncbi:MAG: PIG-L family deacetylase [Deltaproteobacteria bacterium]|nr:PIG-L family deacetylase [Deltaproteobacteria bacterium]